jgi:hypothetical protein
MVPGRTLYKHGRCGCIAPSPPPRDDARPQSHNAPPRAHAPTRTAPWLRSALAAVIFMLATTAHARADDAAYELFIERSPVDAGTVTPTTGTHRFSRNSTVALTADPQPGYRFAYWLGDVSDPRADRTTIVLNGPKVVVAVFHPEPRTRIEDQIRPCGGGGGSSMMVATATDLSAPGWSPAGGSRADATSRVVPMFIPVIVTPEPATVVLLALGIAALRRRRP